ncbi:MAG: fibronectin type III domain-containing protein, partial [Salinispira sp.]
MQIVSINRKSKKPFNAYVLRGFLIILTVLVSACPMPEPEPMSEPKPVPMDMDTSPLIGVWTADNEFHTIEFTATTFIDRVSGLTCDYTDNGNSITLSNCMGLEGAENLNGATLEYTIDGDTLTLNGTVYTRLPEPTVPGTMAAPTLVAGNTQLTVNWTPPENNGSDITAYELRHSDDSGSSWSGLIEILAPATSTAITGLTNGTTYVVQARARNSAGAGDWSESSVGAIPITVSLAPIAFTLVAGDTTITATWAAPTDTGDSAIIHYELQHRVAGASEWEAAVSIAVNADPNHTSPPPITGLTNGTEYEVRVYAVNTEGNGNPATGTATPIGPPAMPNAPTLAVGDTQLTAIWTAPNNGGSPITSYDVQYKVSTATTWTPAPGNPISGTSYTIPSLTNDGTAYDVQVRAVNAQGAGGWSASATRTLLPLAA